MAMDSRFVDMSDQLTKPSVYKEINKLHGTGTQLTDNYNKYREEL